LGVEESSKGGCQNPARGEVFLTIGRFSKKNWAAQKKGHEDSQKPGTRQGVGNTSEITFGKNMLKKKG